MSPEQQVALAFIDSIESALNTFVPGFSNRSYLESARQNITLGDPLSIEPNLQVAAQQLEGAVEGAWANAAVCDHVRTALKQALGDASHTHVRAAALILARWPGGDAETYVKTWDIVP